MTTTDTASSVPSIRRVASRTTCSALAAIALLALLGGCSTYESFLYAPRVAEVRTVLRDRPQEPEVRTLATIVGVRRADTRAGVPRQVETRLRVENRTPAEVTVDPSSMRLLSRDLEPLGPPIATPDGLLRIASSEAVSITGLFPLAGPSSPDLSGLVLEWALEVDGNRRQQSATFEREYARYRGPYYGSYYHFGPYWRHPRSRYHVGFRYWW